MITYPRLGVLLSALVLVFLSVPALAQDRFCMDRTDTWVRELPGFTEKARFAVNFQGTLAVVYEGGKYQVVSLGTGRPRTPEPITLNMSVSFDGPFRMGVIDHNRGETALPGNDPLEASFEIVDVMYMPASRDSVRSPNSSLPWPEEHFAFSDGTFIFAGNAVIQNDDGRSLYRSFFARLNDSRGGQGLTVGFLTAGRSSFDFFTKVIAPFDRTRFVVAGTRSDETHWISLVRYSDFNYQFTPFIGTTYDPVGVANSPESGNIVTLAARFGSKIISATYNSGSVPRTAKDIVWGKGAPMNFAMDYDPRGDVTANLVTMEDQLLVKVMDVGMERAVTPHTASPNVDIRPSVHFFDEPDEGENTILAFDGNEVHTLAFRGYQRTCRSSLSRSRVLLPGFQNLQVTPLGTREDDYVGSAVQDGKYYLRQIRRSVTDDLVTFGG